MFSAVGTLAPTFCRKSAKAVQLGIRDPGAAAHDHDVPLGLLPVAVLLGRVDEGLHARVVARGGSRLDHRARGAAQHDPGDRAAGAEESGPISIAPLAPIVLSGAPIGGVFLSTVMATWSCEAMASDLFRCAVTCKR